MVMLATSESPVACWEFEGDILVLHHPTTISAKYQAMGEGPHTANTHFEHLFSISFVSALRACTHTHTHTHTHF